MRIAQVAPLYESVPPAYYGGTERVVSWLTEELVDQGHDVTLFASAGSQTKARLVPSRRRALRLDDALKDPLASHILMLEQVFQRAEEFDIIHFHVDFLHFPISRRVGIPNLTTLHGRLDVPDFVALFTEFFDMPLVSISDAQRDPLPWANWQATVHHGLPSDALRFSPGPGAYLAFLGRICPEKRVDRAIRVARAAGLPLRIAAKVDASDREYFTERIQPMLRLSGVEYLGEITDKEKSAFLGGAVALLLPIDWPEPFGIAMIEALACGTPVIASRRGSVPEIVRDGETGFVVDSLDHAVAAARLTAGLDRRRCRRDFEERFTAERMARDYLAVYRDLADTPSPRTRALTRHADRETITVGSARATAIATSRRSQERIKT